MNDIIQQLVKTLEIKTIDEETINMVYDKLYDHFNKDISVKAFNVNIGAMAEHLKIDYYVLDHGCEEGRSSSFFIKVV